MKRGGEGRVGEERRGGGGVVSIINILAKWRIALSINIEVFGNR